MTRVNKNYVFLIYLYSFTAHIILIWAGFSCIHSMRTSAADASADLSRNARAPFAFKISLTGRRGNSYDESKIDVIAEFDKISKLVSRKLPGLMNKFEPKNPSPETVFEPPDLEPAKAAFEKLKTRYAEIIKTAEDSMRSSKAAVASKKIVDPAAVNKKNAPVNRAGQKKKIVKRATGKPETGREKTETAPNAHGGADGGSETEVYGNLSGAEKSGNRLAGTPDGVLDPSIELKSIELFKSIVSAKIRSNVKYPHNCRRLGIEGAVRVSFEINSGGMAGGIKITQSSGNRDIDAAAVAAVNEGVPFLPYPRDISRKSLSFVLPLNFKLND